MLCKRLAQIVAFFMCFALMLGMSSAAYASDDSGIIDNEKLKQMTEDFLSERGIEPDRISIGFCYTATGDEWYYNGDEWFYPASMYKVPLMMLMAEKEAAGEIKRDDFIYDKTLGEIETLILTYSNNEWAHTIRKYLGGDEQWRQEAKKYTSLDEKDYDEDYLLYCYFSNRYMTQVMKTLYSSPEKYPNILDCLLVAMPNHYFRLSMEGRFDIAQKYGMFEDMQGSNFNNTSGVIYTENPCIVTVMTRNVDNYEAVIADIALMLTEYSLSLDASLSAYEQEKEDARIAKEQEEQRAAEEKAEKERMEVEAQRLEQERIEQENARLASQKRTKQIIITSAVVICFIAPSVLLIKLISKNKRHRKAPRQYKRDTSKTGYRPKH